MLSLSRATSEEWACMLSVGGATNEVRARAKKKKPTRSERKHGDKFFLKRHSLFPEKPQPLRALTCHVSLAGVFVLFSLTKTILFSHQCEYQINDHSVRV